MPPTTASGFDALMAMRALTPLEARVLGVLAEKAATVPDTYPLSLNALVAGCNQKTARHPVIEASEADVLTDLGLGLVDSADVVICCVDNREARLWINRLCWKVGTPWIDGGIQEINGVAKVFVPPHGSCYECAMTENDYRLIQLRYSCPLLRREDLQQGKVPTAPTIASIVGGLQVQEALKLLHGLPSAEGTATPAAETATALRQWSRSTSARNSSPTANM